MGIGRGTGAHRDQLGFGNKLTYLAVGVRQLSVTKREICQRACQQQKNRQPLSSQSSRQPPDL